MSRHVLITGAAGFLGGALARELLARGAQLTALVRNAERAKQRLADIADHIQFLEWDLNRIAVPELPPGITDLIHAASQASPRFYGPDPVGTAMPNAVGTAALLILNVTAAISYPDLSESGLRDHYFWGILLLLFLVHGPGRLSLDHLIRARVYKRSAN